MVTESEKERIVDLYKTGDYSKNKIATVTGVSYSTVRRIILRYEEENSSTTQEADRKEIEDSDMGKHFSTKKNNKKRNNSKGNRKSSLNNFQKNKLIENATKEQIETANITLTTPAILVNDVIEENNIIENKEIANVLGFEKEGLEILNRPENVVEVGLVSDRHDMYIKNYIFTKELSEEMMFDFDKQYGECENYIKEHITNGQTLVVYCTGLQSALGAVVRACYKNRVNLVLKHYNSQTRSYIPQIVFDEFGEIADTSFPFDSLMKNSKLVLSYKASLSDILKNDTFYCISFNEHLDNNRFKEKGCYYVMTDTMEKAWEIYPDLVTISKADCNKNKKLSVFMSTCNINPSNGFDWGENWVKSYNYYP